ncbi:5-oxoprolinase subunit PxpA [Thalassotalea maritima]|uniref:5-oxoprolinase subunit PxpA n=1 Tax=Thalassotalea maritima TaxID=3242416 RepID=UPI0035280B10
MKLNCDLGELPYSANAQDTSLNTQHREPHPDQQIMPLIDMANIACGGHAGDKDSMSGAVQLAKAHQVMIGAHPSYPDKENFGRISMALSKQQLQHSLNQQIHALLHQCEQHQTELCYVKPHGALYNDMMQDLRLFADICETVALFNQQHGCQLTLMLQALVDNQLHQAIATEHNIEVIYEAFADRAYNPDGSLVSRKENGAVLHERQHIKRRVQQLIIHQEIQTHDAQIIKIKADSLCVHGDNPQAIAIVKSLRRLINDLHEQQ